LIDGADIVEFLKTWTHTISKPTRKLAVKNGLWDQRTRQDVLESPRARTFFNRLLSTSMKICLREQYLLAQATVAITDARPCSFALRIAGQKDQCTRWKDVEFYPFLDGRPAIRTTTRWVKGQRDPNLRNPAFRPPPYPLRACRYTQKFYTDLTWLYLVLT